MSRDGSVTPSHVHEHAVVDAEHTTTGTEVTVRRTGPAHRATVVRGPLFDPRSERLTA